MGAALRTVPQHESLGRRVLVALVAGEVAFAAVLGLTVAGFSALSVAQQREQAISQVSATIAAGLMPTVAYQQESQVQAQLASILQAADVRDVIGIALLDSAGVEIVRRGVDPGLPAEYAGWHAGPWHALLDEQVVDAPVVVDGLHVATARVRFSAAGLSALVLPALASGVVLLSLILVSVPWTAWILSRDVIEPLDNLGHYASRIADGALDEPSGKRAYGEIGDLQDRLGTMARQLKDSFADLAAAYDALDQAKTDIEQLSAVKSDFVAVAAHELRGPLSTISLYTELLESGELGELDEACATAVAAIDSSSSRLNSIVADLMDAALLERGMLPVTFEEVRIGDLVEEAVRDAALQGRAKDMQVVLSGSLPATIISGDALRLRQVMDNLLSNALKYSFSGTQVRVTTRACDDWVEIEVADNGRGIPQGSHAQLFSLFGRLDFGDSREAAGLGLGLAISARIVDAHGGRLSYRANDVGGGTVFQVSLPIHGEPGRRPTGTEIRVSGGTEDRDE